MYGKCNLLINFEIYADFPLDLTLWFPCILPPVLRGFFWAAQTPSSETLPSVSWAARDASLVSRCLFHHAIPLLEWSCRTRRH